MDYNRAYKLASHVLHKLAPHCERVLIVGRLRRHLYDIDDIKLLCIPKRIVSETGMADLFGGTNVIKSEKVHPKFAEVINQYPVVKGTPDGKYTSRTMPDDSMPLHIFMCHKENWGLQVIIKTGDGEFVHKLAKKWVKLGYESIDGYMFYRGQPFDIPEETDLFKILNIEYVQPSLRNINYKFENVKPTMFNRKTE